MNRREFLKGLLSLPAVKLIPAISWPKDSHHYVLDEGYDCTATNHFDFEAGTHKVEVRGSSPNGPDIYCPDARPGLSWYRKWWRGWVHIPDRLIRYEWNKEGQA